ncbi:MAG: molybdopterin dinucleotide binding domain-containing protein [Alphaproteobacteria bacterium]|nr:molybdopterin dinucleotide binding domain-containing protein [Alphaproteobacteria bacterium]
MAKVKEVTIVTYRGIFQEIEEAKGIYSDQYRDQSALIFLDKSDLKFIGADDGQALLVVNEWGSEVVVAKLSEENEAHPGLAFMPLSPWSNQLISGDVELGKALNLKKIVASVSAYDGEVTPISELAERMKAA